MQLILLREVFAARLLLDGQVRQLLRQRLQAVCSRCYEAAAERSSWRSAAFAPAPAPAPAPALTLAEYQRYQTFFLSLLSEIWKSGKVTGNGTGT